MEPVQAPSQLFLLLWDSTGSMHMGSNRRPQDRSLSAAPLLSSKTDTRSNHDDARPPSCTAGAGTAPSTGTPAGGILLSRCVGRYEAAIQSTLLMEKKSMHSWLAASALSRDVTATTRALSPRTASSASANSLRPHVPPSVSQATLNAIRCPPMRLSQRGPAPDCSYVFRSNSRSDSERKCSLSGCKEALCAFQRMAHSCYTLNILSQTKDVRCTMPKMSLVLGRFIQNVKLSSDMETSRA